MYGRGVDCNGFLCTDVRTILEVSMLAFLLSLEIETGKTTEILLDDSLVDSRATADTFSVIVSNSAKKKSASEASQVQVELTSTTNQPCS